MTEELVVIHRDFGVDRLHLARRRGDQGIDLDHRGSRVYEHAPEPLGYARPLLDLVGIVVKEVGDPIRLVWKKTVAGIDS